MSGGGGGGDIYLTIKLHYGGLMRHMSIRSYNGGNLKYFNVGIDRLSMLELWAYVGELGYENESILQFWVKHGDDFENYKKVESDNELMEVIKLCPKNSEVEMFLEQLNANSIATQVSQPNGTQVEREEGNFVEGEDRHEEEFYDSDYDEMEQEAAEVANAMKGKGVVLELDKELMTLFQNEGGEPNCVTSDSDKSLDESDEDGVCKSYPMFNPITEGKNPVLKNGMIFSSKAEAKFAIESDFIRRGWAVQFIKNDKVRLRAVCRTTGCPWFILVSKAHDKEDWQVRSYNPTQKKCNWNPNNKSIKADWIAKTFAKKFKENPKLAGKAFRDEICTTLRTNISKCKTYRGRKKALEYLQGDIAEQFGRLWDYCLEIDRTNPGSTLQLKVVQDEESGKSRFQRFYMCFNACKQGFLKGCRPLVGVDGCFLKTKYGGQLLTAVGLDANNNIYPIAYAVVESETKDSWSWFLVLLKQDLHIKDDSKWTFMSDKQKGLIPAFEVVLPKASNRFCVRHLHSNMKRDGLTGLAIKKAMWSVAKTTRVEAWKRRMDEVKNVNEEAFNWLMKKSPDNWTKSHFNPYPKCDILTNNMCECFNSIILKAREKSIIGLLEGIRNLLMVRMQMNKEKAESWGDGICPKIEAILGSIMKEAGQYIVMESDPFNFQITGPFDQQTVNIRDRKCSCRRWELTGIPCMHAVAAIHFKKEDPFQYVHMCYKVSTYKNAYNLPIYGITSSEFWPKSNKEAPLPPMYKASIGRPKKLRRKEPNEPPPPGSNPHRLRGTKWRISCRTCGEFNHNSKTCPKNFETTNSHQDHAENRQSGSTSELCAPVIVRGGTTFVTASNLRAVISNNPSQCALSQQSVVQLDTTSCMTTQESSNVNANSSASSQATI